MSKQNSIKAMSGWWTGLLLLGLVMTACRQPQTLESTPDIIGGERSTAHEWPQVAALMLPATTDFFCTGTLIHPRVVITAAHCVDDMEPEDVEVSFALDEAQAPWSPSYEVEDLAISPHYMQPRLLETGHFDAAFVILAEPADHTPPASILTDLFTIKNELAKDQKITLVGYGRDEYARSGVKKWVETVVRTEPGSNEIMVGTSDKGGCYGDSGGPAFVRSPAGGTRLFGITSRGPRGCSDHSIYGLVHDHLCWLSNHRKLSERGIVIDRGDVLCSESPEFVPDPDYDRQASCSNPQSFAVEKTFQALAAVRGNDELVCDAKTTESVYHTLDLKYYGLTDLAPLQNMVLKNLELDENKLTHLEPLSTVEALQSLSFRDNQVASLAPLAGQVELKELDAATNRLTDSDVLGDFKNMTDLDLSYNRLQIAQGIEQMTELVALNLSGNQLTDLPEVSSPNLRSLRADDNQLASLSPLQNLADLGADDLKVLSMAGNQLKDISLLSHLPNLQSLRLAHNAIADISSLQGLQKLRVLTVDGNQLTELGHGFVMPQLSHLSAADNKLEQVDLSQMSQLQVVDLSVNALDSLQPFPAEQRVWELNLAHNNIRDLNEIDLPASAQSVDLSFNRLTSLSGLEKVEDLEFLDISGNPLTDNLNRLSSMHNLKEVIVSPLVARKSVFRRLILNDVRVETRRSARYLSFYHLWKDLTERYPELEDRSVSREEAVFLMGTIHTGRMLQFHFSDVAGTRQDFIDQALTAVFAEAGRATYQLKPEIAYKLFDRKGTP